MSLFCPKKNKNSLPKERQCLAYITSAIKLPEEKEDMKVRLGFKGIADLEP